MVERPEIFVPISPRKTVMPSAFFLVVPASFRTSPAMTANAARFSAITIGFPRNAGFPFYEHETGNLSPMLTGSEGPDLEIL